MILGSVHEVRGYNPENYHMYSVNFKQGQVKNLKNFPAVSDNGPLNCKAVIS